jgi:phage-related protein
MTNKTNTAEIAKHSQKAIIGLPWTVTLHPLADVELRAIPLDMQARFVHISELLEELGPQRVGLPHIRPLEGKLWEMRMTGRDGIARAVYAAIRGRRLLVLHVFIKKTQTTPRRALETALKRLEVAA